MPADLTNNKLFAALSAVILTLLLSILGYFITRPYIQYEEGQVYKSGQVAVASLRLENKGYFDAHQVLVEASFPESIVEITSGDAISPITIMAGGKGSKTCVGSIPRVNPAQAVYIYFTIDNSAGTVGQSIPGFVRQVSFQNGRGSPNPPAWRYLLFGFFLLTLGVGVGLLVAYFVNRNRRLTREISELEESASELQGLLQSVDSKLDRINEKVKAIPNVTNVTPKESFSAQKMLGIENKTDS